MHFIHGICVVDVLAVVVLDVVEPSKETYAAQMLLFAVPFGKYLKVNPFAVMDPSLAKLTPRF